jgi:hypothetical protein
MAGIIKKYTSRVFGTVVDGLILVLRDATKALNEKYPKESKEPTSPNLSGPSYKTEPHPEASAFPHCW